MHPKNRLASETGDVLVVRIHAGVRRLVDRYDESVAITVPPHRRALLVRYRFSAFVSPVDILAETRRPCGQLVFASVEDRGFLLNLQELPEGQEVEILPTRESAGAYARLLPRHPVLFCGAVAELPVYAAV